MALSIRTIRLLSLYKLDKVIDSDDEESVNKFIDLIVQERVQKAINKAKLWL